MIRREYPQRAKQHTLRAKLLIYFFTFFARLSEICKSFALFSCSFSFSCFSYWLSWIYHWLLFFILLCYDMTRIGLVGIFFFKFLVVFIIALIYYHHFYLCMALMACKGAFVNKLIVHFFINFHQAAYSNGGSSELLLLFIFSFLQSRVFKHSRFIFIQGREICRRPTCQIARSDVLWDIYLSSDGNLPDSPLWAHMQGKITIHNSIDSIYLFLNQALMLFVRSFVCSFFFL